MTLFEHETVEFPWSEADLAALARLRDVIGSDVLTAEISKGRKTLHAGSFVGLVRLGSRTIELLPKLYRSTDYVLDRAANAGRTVLAMLPYAIGLKTPLASEGPLATARLDWFEALIRSFARLLTDEWGRGPARGYEPVEDDLAAVRGRLRVKDHLARPARLHVLPVAFDEYTADTRLNRVFRFVVERLWERTHDPGNRRLLAGLRERMGEVRLVPAVPPAAAPRSLVTRLTARFGPLLDLARLFLEGTVPLPATGRAFGFAFVMDMNRLFEQFLAGFLSRHPSSAWPCALNACRLLPQAKGAVRSLAVRDDGTPVFRLRPDLAFRDRNGFPLLGDAKYKVLNLNKAAVGVSQGDFYQAAAYSVRYASPRVVLVYPQLSNAPVRAGFRLHRGGRVEVATVELREGLWTVEGRRRLAEELRYVLGGGDNAE